LAVFASLEPPSAMSGDASDGPGTFARHGTERINSALRLLPGVGVAFGEERPIRPWHPKRRPASLLERTLGTIPEKTANIPKKNPGYLERKPGPEFCDFGHSPEASFWPPSTPHALGLARSICTAIIHISRSLSSISSTGDLGRQLPPRCLNFSQPRLYPCVRFSHCIPGRFGADRYRKRYSSDVCYATELLRTVPHTAHPHSSSTPFIVSFRFTAHHVNKTSIAGGGSSAIARARAIERMPRRADWAHFK
jgi:hypothetical protein